MGDLSGLSPRQIIGMYYLALVDNPAPAWVDAISMYMPSDQASEEYKWLGQVPQLRQLLGGRNVKALSEEGMTIINKEFESTLGFRTIDLRRDKTGQIAARINELARRTNAHWASLLSTDIQNGEATACYDGQYYFDTDHSEGSSGTQDNDLTTAITLKTAPTDAEMEAAIIANINAILGYKDDQGELMNEDAAEFLVMVPTTGTYLKAALAAVNNEVVISGGASKTNLLANLSDWSIRVVANARLNSNTDRFYTFRTDSQLKPFIRQEEVAPEASMIGPGSEHEFKNFEHLFGVYASRATGYGLWQPSVVHTFTTA